MARIREEVLINGAYAVVEVEIDTAEIAKIMAARVRTLSARKRRPVPVSSLCGAVRAAILQPSVTVVPRPLNDPRPATSVRCHNTGDHMCALVDCTRCAPMRARQDGLYTADEQETLKKFLADGFAQQRHNAAIEQIQQAFEEDDGELPMNPADFRVDTFRNPERASGWVYRPDACVRVTHLPTGITAECCEHRSVHANKAAAFEKVKESYKLLRNIVKD